MMPGIKSELHYGNIHALSGPLLLTGPHSNTMYPDWNDHHTFVFYLLLLFPLGPACVIIFNPILEDTLCTSHAELPGVSYHKLLRTAWPCSGHGASAQHTRPHSLTHMEPTSPFQSPPVWPLQTLPQ